jgi:hypothetical protein
VGYARLSTSVMTPIVVPMMVAVVSNLRNDIDSGASTRTAPYVVARSRVAMPPVGSALAGTMISVHLLYLRSSLDRSHRGG